MEEEVVVVMCNRCGGNEDVRDQRGYDAIWPVGWEIPLCVGCRKKFQKILDDFFHFEKMKKD